MPPKAKADAKAAAAEKAAEKAALAVLGITPALKKMMTGDALLCTLCSATQLGPVACECKQSSKPAADYDATEALLAAAKARVALEKEATRLANAAQQANVASQRQKAKEVSHRAAFLHTQPAMIADVFSLGARLVRYDEQYEYG